MAGDLLTNGLNQSPPGCFRVKLKREQNIDCKCLNLEFQIEMLCTMASAGWDEGKYFKDIIYNRNFNATLKKVLAIVHLVTKQHQSGMLHVLCLGIFPLLDSFSRLKPCNIPQVSEILFLFNFSNLRDKSQEVNIYVEEATWKPDYQLKNRSQR